MLCSGKPFLPLLRREMSQRNETVAEFKESTPHLEAHLVQIKFQHAHTRQQLDAEYLEAHKRLKNRVKQSEWAHAPAGDVGFNSPNLKIVHNTLERIGFDAEDI